MSVTECILVQNSTVSLHSSLKIEGKSDICYSRPLVTFQFVNSTQTFRGQLGTRNEILLSTTYVEKCQPTAEHYFQAGDQIYYYKDYEFSKTLNLTDVSPLSTFIALNISFIENVDFKVIELYSQDEKRVANVYDIESMFRDYAYYTHRLSGLRRDLDTSKGINSARFVEVFGEIINELGTVGKAAVNVLSGVVTIFGGIVNGILSLIANPFGGLLTFFLIGGLIVLVIIMSMRTQRMWTGPVKTIYPSVDALEKKIKPMDDTTIKRILLGMQKLHESTKSELTQSGGFFKKALGVAAAATDIALRQRHRAGGYETVKQDDDTSSPDLESPV